MLLVSIHDVAPRFLSEVRTLRERLAGWGVPVVTLLAVPDHHGSSPLARCRDTVRWLRSCAGAGDEVALHGFHHLARGAVPSRWDRARAALLTAGEGEMLAVPPAQVAPILARGRDVVADVVGAEPVGFVAPAWLEPRGLADVLGAVGFRWHETSLYLEALPSGRRLVSPVLGWATRSARREAAAVAWAAVMTPVARRIARASGVVRVALHPGDVHSAPVMASIERTVHRLLAAGLQVRTTAEVA
jgi:predicted deacetylase